MQVEILTECMFFSSLNEIIAHLWDRTVHKVGAQLWQWTRVKSDIRKVLERLSSESVEEDAEAAEQKRALK